MDLDNQFDEHGHAQVVARLDFASASSTKTLTLAVGKFNQGCRVLDEYLAENSRAGTRACLLSSSKGLSCVLVYGEGSKRCSASVLSRIADTLRSDFAEVSRLLHERRNDVSYLAQTDADLFAAVAPTDADFIAAIENADWSDKHFRLGSTLLYFSSALSAEQMCDLVGVSAFPYVRDGAYASAAAPLFVCDPRTQTIDGGVVAASRARGRCEIETESGKLTGTVLGSLDPFVTSFATERAITVEVSAHIDVVGIQRVPPKYFFRYVD